MGWSWALAYFTVLSLKSIILLMMLSHAVALHVAQFLLPAFPSLWIFFGKYLYEHFPTDGFRVMVPEGCHSQGCHGYLLGLLRAPFCFTRHLPHTYMYVSLIGLICRYYHCHYNSNLSKCKLI